MNVWRKQYPNPPLWEPSGEWFVNRKVDLDFLWKWAISIPTKGSRSITGLRRTGKSTMRAKLYTRLYFEQEQVMPIYISFARHLHRKEPITAQQFAEEFLAGAVRSYLTFTYKRPEWMDPNRDYPALVRLAEEIPDKVTQEWFERHQLTLEEARLPSHSVVQSTINLLAGHARWKKQPMLVMIDEFQILTEVLYPEDGRVMDITDSFQHASESWHAPLLVSGSSISMLQGQALGGLLSGRFSPHHIGPLEPEHAAKMVFHIGKTKDIPVTEELAKSIVETTQGYPYSIECIMFSFSPDLERFPDTEAVDDVVNFELSNRTGALGRHYEEEYGKYVTELNGDNITRKILYWITNQDVPKLHLHPRRVSEAISIDIIEVQQSLEKLCQLDIIQRVAGRVYTGPTDPLMRMYLNYSHYLNVDDLSPDDAVKKLQRKLNEMQGEINRKTGHFTEIIVAGVLKSFYWQVIDGEAYFSIAGDIKLPYCDQIHRRSGVVKDDTVHEIDLIGEYRLTGLPKDVDRESNAINGAWMVSVRYRGKAMGVADVRAFMNDVAVVQEEKGYGKVVRWYFSKTGFTKGAKALLRSEGIYHSDLAQFNLLTEMFDLLPLRV